ncbi:hypothetical protein [Clostridium cochlearium]|uniref:hypothetical protein n=1 Tax=Clostridium cochlearium TaxID=1494 RepID=UPI0022DFD0D9|nr:hypothetical protein [Clostridium cochlearium]
MTEDSEAEHQRHFKFSYFTKSLALAKPKERSYKIKNFLECNGEKLSIIVLCPLSSVKCNELSISNTYSLLLVR